jgi:hypothetical protein
MLRHQDVTNIIRKHSDQSASCQSTDQSPARRREERSMAQRKERHVNRHKL